MKLKFLFLGTLTFLLVFYIANVKFNEKFPVRKHGDLMNTTARTFDTVLYCSVYELDPLDAQTDCHVILLNQIFDTLFEISPETLDIKQSLVAHHKYDNSFKTYTFYLQPNAFFSDGNSVTTKDVFFSFERLIKNRKGPYRDFFNIFGAEEYFKGKSKRVDGLKPIDDKTFQIVLKEPNPLFLYTLTTLYSAILPSHYKNEIESGEFFKFPVGSGAYQLSHLDMNESIQLTSNPNYFLGKPYVEKLNFWRLSEDEAKRRFKSGNLDQLFPYRFSTTEFEKFPALLVPYKVYYTIYLSFNYNTPDNLFYDKKWRTALKKISRIKELQKKIQNPMLEPATGFLPSGMIGYTEIPATPDFILDQEIVKNLQQRRIKISVSRGVDEHDKIASFLQKNYTKHGIKADFIIEDVGKVIDGIQRGKYDAMIVSNYFSYPDSYSILQLLRTGNALNVTNYSNLKIDQLLDQSLSFNKKKDRKIFYQEINKMLFEDVATLNFFYGANQTAVFKQGWQIPSLNYLGEIFLKYRGIRPKNETRE